MAHSEEKDAVIHSPECSFKVGVGGVYVFFGDFGVFIHHYVSGEAVIYLAVRAKSISRITEDAFGFRKCRSYARKDRGP